MEPYGETIVPLGIRGLRNWTHLRPPIADSYQPMRLPRDPMGAHGMLLRTGGDPMATHAVVFLPRRTPWGPLGYSSTPGLLLCICPTPSETQRGRVETLWDPLAY